MLQEEAFSYTALEGRRKRQRNKCKCFKKDVKGKPRRLCLSVCASLTVFLSLFVSLLVSSCSPTPSASRLCFGLPLAAAAPDKKKKSHHLFSQTLNFDNSRTTSLQHLHFLSHVCLTFFRFPSLALAVPLPLPASFIFFQSSLLFYFLFSSPFFLPRLPSVAIFRFLFLFSEVIRCPAPSQVSNSRQSRLA